MPQAVYAFAEWVISGLVTIGFSGATAVTIWNTAVQITVLIGLSKISEKLFGIPDLGKSATSFNHTIKGTIEHQRIVYGETIAGGVVWYMNTSGENNEYLWHGIMIAGHEGEDITDVWDVNSGDFRGHSDQDPCCNFKKFLGTVDQTAPADLVSTFFTEITSAHQGQYIAWLQTKFTYVESQTQVWSAGRRNFLQSERSKNIDRKLAKRI